VSVVSLGIARKPEIPMRAIAALEAAGIEPQLITTTAGRVTVLVAAAQVDDAVRLLHGIFVPAVEEGTDADRLVAVGAA
jgi:aspartokinase